MKIDKKKLEAMAKLSDEALWREISSVARAHGVKMPEKQPAPEELAKVRAALRDADKLNLGSAMRMINDLKRSDR